MRSFLVSFQSKFKSLLRVLVLGATRFLPRRFHDVGRRFLCWSPCVFSLPSFLPISFAVLAEFFFGAFFGTCLAEVFGLAPVFFLLAAFLVLAVFFLLAVFLLGVAFFVTLFLSVTVLPGPLLLAAFRLVEAGLPLRVRFRPAGAFAAMCAASTRRPLAVSGALISGSAAPSRGSPALQRFNRSTTFFA